MIKMIHVCDRCSKVIEDKSSFESCEFIYDGKRMRFHFHTACFIVESISELKQKILNSKHINAGELEL